MIFVTGDTHGLKDIDKFNSPKFQKNKGNYLIITGDCGVVWSKETIDKNVNYYNNLGYIVLFVDGNNENFDMLNAYPVQEWNGGKVHQIAQNVIHLMRGEVFTIENKTFLAFGGADSWDRHYEDRRKKNINWWPEERATEEEFQNCLKNLKQHNNKVDFIITHETTSQNINKHFYWNDPEDMCKFMDRLENIVDYRFWFFGHHHDDMQVDSSMAILSKRIVNLNDLQNKKFKSQESDKWFQLFSSEQHNEKI